MSKRVLVSSDDAPSVLAHKDVLAELHVWVARHGMSEHDVGDLCQEVVDTALRKLDTFDGRADFRAWLWGIAKNVVANFRARCRRLRATGGEETELCDPTPNAEVQMESRELHAELTAGIDAIDVEILEAHRIDGLTFPQIGQALGMSAGAVRSRCRRALAAYEKAWRKHQAKQRSRGVFVLPISGSALLDAERARYCHVPEHLLQRLHDAIEALLRDARPPLSHARPVARGPAAADPVEAVAPGGSFSPWLPWVGTIASVVAIAIGALVLLALTPHDTRLTALIPHDTRLTQAQSDPAMLPAPEVPSIPGVSAAPAMPATPDVPTAPADASASPAGRPAPTHARHGAEAPATVARAARPSDAADEGSLGYPLLRAGQRAVERGDIDCARVALAAYDAMYPRDPFPAARARLVHGIGDLAGGNRATTR